MCEIFPEVKTCWSVFSIRVGMMFIAILSISTGAITLGVTEQRSNIDIDKVKSLYSNSASEALAEPRLDSDYYYDEDKATNDSALQNKVSDKTKPKKKLSNLTGIITASISGMGVIFMLAGVCLLFSTMADEEGYAQAFVWLVMLNILIGSLLILAITYECLMTTKCLLGNMDWLSGAVILIIVIFYFMLWYYFACVANSYVVNLHT